MPRGDHYETVGRFSTATVKRIQGAITRTISSYEDSNLNQIVFMVAAHTRVKDWDKFCNVGAGRTTWSDSWLSRPTKSGSSVRGGCQRIGDSPFFQSCTRRCETIYFVLIVSAYPFRTFAESRDAFAVNRRLHSHQFHNRSHDSERDHMISTTSGAVGHPQKSR
jgi:hypothetical protein